MKSAEELYNDRTTIKTGFYKGARITLSKASIIQLIKDYRSQFPKNINNGR